ncbi:MAG: GNAT family N-acetyltransferase, partial [Candidatus Eremiobacteraeota bacterium]|nr:GNAT family N-acetyltransferase [Candidatus Eremiobacteraeota bacterium]
GGARQPVFALRQTTLVAHAPDGLAIARARPDEVGELTIEAAKMSAGELGGPAYPIEDAYRRRIAAAIDAGQFWRARRDGVLVFQCYLGPHSRSTAQIQGVWTPRAARGRGDATRALAAIASALLGEHHSLSLYVNDFNKPAIALYERVGFERAGEFQTVLF